MKRVKHFVEDQIIIKPHFHMHLNFINFNEMRLSANKKQFFLKGNSIHYTHSKIIILWGEENE